MGTAGNEDHVRPVGGNACRRVAQDGYVLMRTVLAGGLADHRQRRVAGNDKA